LYIVYDLSTDHYHFSAGVGRMVVHNTDSIMIQLPHPTPVPAVVTPEWAAECMQYVFKQGAMIGEDISARLPAPLELELEGVLFPSAYYKKKVRCSGIAYNVHTSSLTMISLRACALTELLRSVMGEP
jgi:DNA polymerase elongation subunit (family B)